MAATFEYNEDNGTATGSPPKGTTRTTAVTQVNWKDADDVATAYSSAPIVAGTNSYTKYQFGKFTGTFNQILNGKWSAHTAPGGALATGLTLHGQVRTLYTTPAKTTDSGMDAPVDFTTAVPIGSGETVLFHTTGPEGASPTATLSAAGYTQYLISQLQTSGSAAPGDMATITTTLQYDEN